MPTTKKGICPYATKSHLLTLTSPCESLMGTVFNLRHDFALGGGVGAEFVGDDLLWRTSLLAQELHQQSPRGPCISSDLHDFVKRVSFLIDSPPEIVILTVNGDHDP